MSSTLRRKSHAGDNHNMTFNSILKFNWRWICILLLQTMLLSWKSVKSFTAQSFFSNSLAVKYSYQNYATKRANNPEYDISEDDENKPLGQTINWYPGHIAKAERELADYLKKVDVVIEVRDARIPLATTHPKVPQWVGSKPLIVAIARLDQISSKALADWREYYAINPAHPERPDAKVYFVDGKLGAGILTLKKQALKAGITINAKRVKRGIQPRAVRAAVIGYPNVGKSALINRLLGRKMAKSRNLPGVTRQLQWVRLGGDQGDSLEDTIELLDSPGIIPAQQVNQLNAIKLAICNDIGEASYDRVVVAGQMCDLINSLHNAGSSTKYYVKMNKIIDRYEMPFNTMTGEEIVYETAEKYYQGNMISAADKLLGDFRRGMLGQISLESAPLNRPAASNSLKSKLAIASSTVRFGLTTDAEDEEDNNNNNNDKYNKPDPVENNKNEKLTQVQTPKVNLDIGRGNYEGW